jgi:hypothetical protein
MFFLDDDLSWPIEAVRAIIETEGDIIAGAYRMKCDVPRFPALVG